MTFVTKTYDFHTALSTRYDNVVIHSTNYITDFQTLVNTNHGEFICESFSNNKQAGDVYMKVYAVH